MAKEKLKDLLWDEEAFLAETIPRLKQEMLIDDKGNPAFLVPHTKFSDTQKLSLYLTARYFANKLKLVDSRYLTIEELRRCVGIKYDIAAARLKEMFDRGIVEKSKEEGKRTRYAILPHRISGIVDNVLQVKMETERKAKK